MLNKKNQEIKRKNKKGIIRIIEAVIAILLLTGVLLVVYSNSAERVSVSEQIYNLQKEVLSDISNKPDLRLAVLNDEIITLKDYADTKIPSAFDFEIRICGLVDVEGNVVPCQMTEYIEEDIFVDEVIISAVLEKYEPKKVKLFIWRT